MHMADLDIESAEERSRWSAVAVLIGAARLVYEVFDLCFESNWAIGLWVLEVNQ